jgi:hypothetical protein
MDGSNQDMSDLFNDDTTAVRVALDQRDQNDYILVRADPYGHWAIKKERGAVPAALAGQYTRKEYAIDAIKNYLNTFSLPKKIKEIKTEAR